MRAIAWVIVVTGCDRIAGIPDPKEVDAAIADAAFDGPEPEALCNYLDDDGDGLIDEGHDYIEAAGARRVIDIGAYPGVWWLAREADRVAVSWATGQGDASDVVNVQVFDLDGVPVGDKVTTSVDQPWSLARGFWTGDRFVITGTQRSYACGGEGSTSCNTYLMAVDTAGARVIEPRLVATDSHAVAGAFIDQDSYIAAFVPGLAVGSVRIRSIPIDGIASPLDRELFATTPGESVYVVRAVRDGSKVLWTYTSTTTGLTLRITDLAGATTLGPIALAPAAQSSDRGAEHALVVDGALVIGFGDRESAMGQGAAIGRWSLDGVPLDPPVRLPGSEGVVALADGGSQLYALAIDRGEPDGMTPVGQLWRLTRDGRLIGGSGVPIPGEHTYLSLVSTPTGPIIVGSAYGPIGEVTLTKLGCP